MSFVRATTVLGLVWAVWHFPRNFASPYFAWNAESLWYLSVFTVQIVLGNYLLCWMFRRHRRSAASGAGPPAPQPPVFKQNSPPAQSPPAQPAIENIATAVPATAELSPQTLRQSLTPANIRHPRASREALLGDVRVAYEFKRGKRRTIGFSVGPDGLAVRAPKWVPLPEVDKAVIEKSAWILKKLQEMRARGDQMEASRIDWRDGCSVPFLGQSVTVRLDPRHAFNGVGAELKNDDAGTDNGPSGASLHVGLPHNAEPAQIRDAVQAWLMRQSKRIFTERLGHFAPHLGVKWRRLSLSSAGTRWGSASADGSIRLNWRLGSFQALGDRLRGGA